MKKFLILVVFGLLISGCMSDNLVNNIPEPVSEDNLEWIGNPSSGLDKVEAERTISQIVSGRSGGTIYIMEQVGTLNILGSLSIPKGAYSGNQNITITFNDALFYQDYNPSPFIFKSDLVLNLTYTNINLTGIDPATVGFYYMAEDGQYYKASYDGLTVDVVNNTLSVSGAKLPHFSRWGWAKSTDQ